MSLPTSLPPHRSYRPLRDSDGPAALGLMPTYDARYFGPLMLECSTLTLDRRV
jgi:hypothetical protein